MYRIARRQHTYTPSAQTLLEEMAREEREIIRCRGHPLVTARHPTTFEVTRDEEVTACGDCIIAVGADKGAADLSPSFTSLLSRDDSLLITRLHCGQHEVIVRSSGSSRFMLTHPTDLVWRRSTYVDDRTVGIASDTVARTLPRDLVAALRDCRPLVVELTVKVP